MLKEKESTVEAKLALEVKKISGWCIKMPTIHNAGLPDRLCLLPGGRLIFVELKATGKKPSPLQEAIHRKLRGIGFTVLIIDSTEGVKEFIAKYDIQDLL